MLVTGEECLDLLALFPGWQPRQLERMSTPVTVGQGGPLLDGGGTHGAYADPVASVLGERHAERSLAGGPGDQAVLQGVVEGGLAAGADRLSARADLTFLASDEP